MAGGDRKNADAALAAAIAGGATVEAAAKQAGVSVRTAHRRLDDPAFQQLLIDARNATLSQVVGALTLVARVAVNTLARLQSPAEPSSIQLGAARAALDLGIRLRELESLERRVAALEQNAVGGNH